MNLFIKKIVITISSWSHQGVPMTRNKIFWYLAICLLIGLALRLMTLYFEPVISRDGIKYILEAEKLIESGSLSMYLQVYNTRLTNLFFTSIISSQLFNFTPYEIVMFTNLLLGTLFPIIIFLIGKIIFEKSEIALAGAYYAAVHPNLINYSIEIQREMSYLFFVGLFIMFLLLLLKNKKWWWNIAMILSALISMTLRYEGVELFLFICIVYAIMFYTNRSNVLKHLSYVFTFFTICLIGVTIIYLTIPEHINNWLDNFSRKTKSSIEAVSMQPDDKLQ